MKTAAFTLLGLGLTLHAGCANPPPTCAPRGESYKICSDNRVWTCPVGDAATVAFNQQLDADCEQTVDPIQCIFDAEYKMIEMPLAADCAAAGQVCVEDNSAVQTVASCEMK